MKPKFYRVDDVPATISARFDKAVEEVRRESEAAGEGHVPAATAFVALLYGADIAGEAFDRSIDSGRVAARRFVGEEEKTDRHFHLPPDVKALVDSAAEANGINIGALGRLVMAAVLGDEDEAAAVASAVEVIKRGLAARRGAEAALASAPAQEVPA